MMDLDEAGCAGDGEESLAALAGEAFREFVAVVKALRTPGTGCPWDLEQTHLTLRPYLIEETYEVLEAIDRNDEHSLRDELGDLLLQVVLHAQLAADRSAFSITEVVRGITAKMIRRHPHVFGSVQVSGSADVSRNWEQIKAAEAQQRGELAPADGPGGLPEGLPALLRAQRVGEKAARAQSEAASLADVLERVKSAFASLEAAVRQRTDNSVPSPREPAAEERTRLEVELGEVLFGLCQLARRLGVNAEDSLRVCTLRFVDSFRLRGLTPQARQENEDPQPGEQV